MPPIGLIQDGVFLNRRVGIALGKGIFRTRDGGYSWEKVNEIGLRQLAFYNDNVGYASGGGWGGSGSGLVYKTTDAGVTWEQVFNGPRGLFSLALLGDSCVLVGSPWVGNSLWRSIDAGKTWDEVKGAGADAGMILALTSQQVIAINLQGNVFRSEDAGATWKKVSKVNKHPHRGRMTLASDGTIYLANMTDHPLQRSTDVGTTWQPVANAPENVTAINMLPSGAMVLATTGGLWESDQQHKHWQHVLSTTNNINALTKQGENLWAWGGIWGGYNFGSPAMLITRQASNDAPIAPGVVTLDFDMPKDGFATLVIDQLDGTRLRNLVSDVPVKTGHAKFNWDGRDEWGKVVTPGTYQWRGLMHEGIHTDYQFHFNNPAQTPWDTQDNTGGWGADHSNPQSIAFGNNQIYIAWPFAESGTRIIAIDPNTGQRRWGEKRRLTLGNHYGGHAIAVAADEQYLYAAMQTHEQGIGFYRLGAATGQVVPFVREVNGKRISEGDHVCRAKPASMDLPSLEAMSMNQSWNASNAAASLRGCALDNKAIYIASYHDNAIYVCDKATAADIKTITVDRVAGIAKLSEGQLLAISKTGVVQIDAGTGKQTVIVEQGTLIAPMDIAIASDGSFYVSQRGNAMDVVHFNPQGKRIGSIGKTGGRPASGVYDRQGMLMPRGLALDARQQLWVAEEDFAPRRVSVWESQGSFVREYVGCSTYGATGGAVNPMQPDMALDTGTLFTLDWKTHHSSPSYSLPRIGSATGALFGWPGVGSDSKPHAKTRFLTYKNRLFLVRQDPPLMLFERVGEKWMPRAAWGTLYHSIRKLWGVRLDLSMVPGVDLTKWDASGHGKALKGFVDHTYIWVDQNGDGLCQSEEFASQQTPLGNWGAQHMDVDDQLTALLGDCRMPLHGWSACGAPMYRFEDVQPFAQVPTDRPNTFDINYQTQDHWLIADGYTKAWADSANANVPGLFCGFDASGVRRWFYPSWYHVHGSHKAPPPQPGLLAGPWYFGGDVMLKDVGDVVHVMDNLGAHDLFTSDGLYLAKLFTDGRTGGITPDRAVTGMNVDAISNQSEGWASGFFRNSVDGQVYVISCLAKANAPCISRVNGLETVQRIAGGKVTLDVQAITRAQEIPARTFPGVPMKPLRVVHASKSPVIDGKLDDWDMSQGVGLPVDAQRGALINLSWDQDNLYMAYRVRDPNPLINHGDDPKLMFKTGSALELKLAVNGDASLRRKPIAGDIRLLMSVMQDKPVAVLYQQVAPDASDSTSFSSPNQRVLFDSVHVVADVHMAYERQDRSYCFEAAVAWASLGMDAKKFKALQTRGDIGVIYSDQSGSINILRTCWASQNTGLVSDVAAEAAIDPSEWGLIKFEP